MIQTAQPARSDISIDTMRACACLALVSYHVVGSTSGSGLELPADHWLSVLNLTFADMRMPLFSFLSGMVFVGLGQARRGVRDVLGSKARRLLVPMLSVGILFWLLRDLAGQAQQPVGTLLVLPFAHFWFLQATFAIMAIFTLAVRASGGRDRWVAGVLMLLSAAAWITGTVPSENVFSAVQALYLMPFFLAGYLCRRLGAPVIGASWACAVLAALVGLGLLLATDTITLPQIARRGLSVGCGLAFCLVLLSLRLQSGPLARLGALSYAVFLFHVFFTAATFEAWSVLWPSAPPVLMWVSGIAAGVAGPVLVHRAVMQSATLSFLLLGLRPPPGLLSNLSVLTRVPSRP